MHKNSIFILLLTLISCSTNQNNQPVTTIDSSRTQNFQAKTIIIENENAGWGGNIKLSYTNSLTTDRSVIYQVNSTYDNQNLGFEVSVPKNGLAILTIKSTGKNSDNFLHFFAKLNKQKVDTSSRFIDSITADCINMGDYVDSLNKQSNGDYVTTSQYKLFIQGQDEDDYAELYLNVHEADHQIELKEKDKEYRPAIVRLLTRKNDVQSDRQPHHK